MKKKLIIKKVNGILRTFREVDGVLFETVDSYLATGGKVQLYDSRGLKYGEYGQVEISNLAEIRKSLAESEEKSNNKKAA